MDEGKDSKAGGKQRFINNNINKTNKNYPVGERGAGQGRAGKEGQGRAGQGRAGQGKARQGRARQGKARHKPHSTSNIWQRTHTELQTQVDYKGSK